MYKKYICWICAHIFLDFSMKSSPKVSIQDSGKIIIIIIRLIKEIKNETPKWEIFANNSYPQKPQYKFNSL